MFTPGVNGPAQMFQSQAGDLHSPTMAMLQSVATPFGAPASMEAMQSGAVMDPSAFHTVPSQPIPPFQPFLQVPGQNFVPSSFVQQDTGYETMEQDPSPIGSEEPDARMVGITSKSQLAANAASMALPLPPSAEKFRFHSTLNAATAMVKQSDEIPITYLNKGQAYSLSVADTQGALPVQPGTRYRTFIRVSFEDEEQRAKPSVCWGLWKEGRGTNEAHQRGGKLQAVEYVEASQPAEGDDKRTRIELESSSFDGFCVTWTPGTAGAPEVNIAVRFNFLSTDFSHSKGVKGIPVRLCAKTTRLSAGEAVENDAKPEVCYCKVKLFRDHGAERKLSNDVAHIKKSIEKLKQQISQAESGVKDSKRKRQSIASKASVDSRSGKVQKHKRTWSMSSTSSANGSRPTLEDDLHFRLQTLQDMFTSTRPISILFLRGEDQDDMDLHPVSMPGDLSPATREGRNWQARSGRSSVRSSLVSPSPSSLSLASQSSTGGHWQNFDSRNDQVTTVNKTDDAGTLSGWIEALGVDPSYRPPQERGPKPVACFYVQYNDSTNTEKREYHRAIYLYQRSLEELNKQIAAKWGLAENRIKRTIHLLPSGLEVEMDNDVIQELREGQDMRLEVEEIVEQSGKDWQMSVDGEPNEETRTQQQAGLVLRLAF